MSSEESRRLRAVYAAALQRDPEERNEYLNGACADQPELRAKVALLQAHSQDFLEAEDLLMGAVLVIDAFMLAAWPLTAVLTMALGIAIALTALVLEPATTRAALGDV
jgi:hypothetical protein